MGGAAAAWRNGRAMGGEGGQALVEAAFALPLTVVLILCAIQITQLQRARLLVEYAAFSAARAGAVLNGNDGRDGTDGPMHDAAALSLASSQGPADGLGAFVRTFASFRAREAALRALGLPLVQVTVLNPRRGDFQRFGQHLGGREIDFDDVRPKAVDASLLSIQVRYLVELRVPLANKLIHSLWLASRAGRRGRRPGRARFRLAGARRQARPVSRARAGLPHHADAVEPLPAVGGAVILLFHRLRRDEEGQVLVLGAIFGLVLMLCVLSTVNLGRAVYAKVQLQTAADAAAYSQAAVEARVLNFTAYTNRAMVVHYASIMAAAAYLTWVHFLWAAIAPILSVLRNVPYAGPVFAALQEAFRGLLVLLDSAVAVMTPLVSAANVVLYTLQEGAWLSVGAPGGGRLSRLPPEAHSGDSAAAPYQEIWPGLVHAANQAVFARTRGKPLLLEDAADSAKVLLNDKDEAVQLARAHMIEIANSARHPWVAYGDRWNDPSRSPLARHAAWQVGCPIFRGHIGFQIVSRTELGGPPPPASASRARAASQSQVYSAQRLQLGVRCGPIDKRYSVFQLATMDQVFASLRPGKWSDFEVGQKRGGLLGRILGYILRGVLSGVSRAAARTRPNPNVRLFWLSPYVSFAPQARSRPGGALGQLGNFAQPDVLVG